MPPDPVQHLSDYVSLRDYFERLLLEHEKAVTVQFQSMQLALEKASDALSARLAGMNEFRDTLRDQAARFVTVSTLDTKTESIDTRLKSLENKGANMEGRMFMIGAAVTVINIVLAILGFIIKK